ncbi:MAG: methyltransferase domain-containing protein [Patescibacteria group bacterium]|nr:methyltransferase domain-containing protein [Patescibacteria group bacterium]MDD5121295.1 methyltransferase domain-containing protein [Patescibacteria group bacterium]MDD5221725.1 methyltransferase domain-containing protein [Patescibacteria group bacterium]MDD5395786.1 methyltransferase domain-containing protein [Patescibacteria group bacterium]
MNNKVEAINCPYCHKSENIPWAKENEFTAVKCLNCGLVYVNPRPCLSLIDEAVKTGVHREINHKRTAVTHRAASKINLYKKIIADMFSDVWLDSKEISWLDVGAGFGEVLEAVLSLAPKGSKIEGLEPMEPKRTYAEKRGLTIRGGYLNSLEEKFSFLSLINVFSHLPDFDIFLEDVRRVLLPGGEFLIETGNIADLDSRDEVPTELDLPDHLVFAGEKHIISYLTRNGFSVVNIKRRRKDGIINFVKNIIKKIMGQRVSLRIPYTSKYRTILIRARLNR